MSEIIIVNNNIFSTGQTHIPPLGVRFWVLWLLCFARMRNSWRKKSLSNIDNIWQNDRFAHVCACKFSVGWVNRFSCSLICESVKSMCVQAFMSLLPKPWRGNAFTLDALFLSVISQLDELQGKHEGHDGNLFTHFQHLEAAGLTSMYYWGVKLKAHSQFSSFLGGYFPTVIDLKLTVALWNAELRWNTTFGGEWVTMWVQEKLLKSFNGVFGTTVKSTPPPPPHMADIFTLWHTVKLWPN